MVPIRKAHSEESRTDLLTDFKVSSVKKVYRKVDRIRHGICLFKEKVRVTFSFVFNFI